MSDTLFHEMEEVLRETFEGGRPGEGTQYLDHDSGILNTEFISEGAGMGVIAHLAYHLGAIRQLLPPV